MNAIAAALLVAVASAASAADPGEGLPNTLRETGLYERGTDAIASGVLAFTPQYPLWTDAAQKRRWIRLPRGAAIDASNPDAWQFPPGTRLWKEFAYDGRRVETRLVERRRDGSWRFATYIWNEAGTDAVLAPASGIASMKVAQAPGGQYAIPSRTDCIACHGSAPAPVLGFSALQLPAGDLRALVARGLVRGLPPPLLREAPQIAADSPVERAALGYLHGNCAHCHNTGENRAPVDLTLAQRAADPSSSRAEVLRATVNAATRWRAAEHGVVVAPGDPASSALLQRMQVRDGRTQMPPLGTLAPDEEGIALMRRWIADLPQPPKENPR